MQVRRQVWWLQAAELGMMAGSFIWMASTAFMLLGSFLVAWGPVTFLHRASFVGLYVIVVLLAFTAPVWVIGGIMMLISLGSREKGATITEHGASETSDGGMSVADGQGRMNLCRWSHRWDRFEQGVMDWFILHPALLEQHFELETHGNRYLRRYLKWWLVGSLSLFVVLSAIALGTRAKVAPGDTFLEGYFEAVTFLEFALGVGLCSLLMARYAVTRVMLKRRVEASE